MKHLFTLLLKNFEKIFKKKLPQHIHSDIHTYPDGTNLQQHNSVLDVSSVFLMLFGLNYVIKD